MAEFSRESDDEVSSLNGSHTSSENGSKLLLRLLLLKKLGIIDIFALRNCDVNFDFSTSDEKHREFCECI